MKTSWQAPQPDCILWLNLHVTLYKPPFAIFSFKRYEDTVYPKKYTNGFCFAVLCCGYTLTDFPISIRLTSLALWQSNDCPSASKATLMNMDKNFMWIHYEQLHNHNKAKHNKTVCIFLGIYCIYILYVIQQEISKEKKEISTSVWCADKWPWHIYVDRCKVIWMSFALECRSLSICLVTVRQLTIPDPIWTYLPQKIPGDIFNSCFVWQCSNCRELPNDLKTQVTSSGYIQLNRHASALILCDNMQHGRPYVTGNLVCV